MKTKFTTKKKRKTNTIPLKKAAILKKSGKEEMKTKV
jgi:hypothetical protein